MSAPRAHRLEVVEVRAGMHPLEFRPGCPAWREEHEIGAKPSARDSGCDRLQPGWRLGMTRASVMLCENRIGGEQ